MSPHPSHPGQPAHPGQPRQAPQADEAVEVLRAVWSAQGQPAAGLDLGGAPAKTCQRMADVGFDGLAGGGEDLRSAWRSRLAREGKLSPTGETVADLVMRPAPGRPAQPRPAQPRTAQPRPVQARPAHPPRPAGPSR